MRNAKHQRGCSKVKQMMELQLFSSRWRHNQQLTTLISSRQLPKFIFSTKVRSSIQIEIAIFPTKACKALKTGASSTLNEWNFCQSKKLIVPSFVTIQKKKILVAGIFRRNKGRRKSKEKNVLQKLCKSQTSTLELGFVICI